MSSPIVRYSKFLSLVLRHKPEEIGLNLDAEGWTDVEELLERAQRHGVDLDRDLLEEIVATSDKKRFALSENGSRIRANQGHSVKVDLNLERSIPPSILYHGTARRFLDSIMEQGLIKGKRHHVHLSADIETAYKVGVRHGKPVVLLIDAARMHGEGKEFFLSANGVWLTEHVPVIYLRESASEE